MKKAKYGLKVIETENGRGTKIIIPKLELFEYRFAKDAKKLPVRFTINSKVHRRFKTVKSAKAYIKKYKNNRTREINKILNNPSLYYKS